MNYFNISNQENQFNPQKNLNESTFLLLGAGNIGSNILFMLSAIEPKKIIIVDYGKAEAAAATVKELNPGIITEAHNKEITCPEDVLQFINTVIPGKTGCFDCIAGMEQFANTSTAHKKPSGIAHTIEIFQLTAPL
jgi:threonine dehydrogenase-like Zn-dependent dehydrogenase